MMQKPVDSSCNRATTNMMYKENDFLNHHLYEDKGTGHHMQIKVSFNLTLHIKFKWLKLGIEYLSRDKHVGHDAMEKMTAKLRKKMPWSDKSISI